MESITGRRPLLACSAAASSGRTETASSWASRCSPRWPRSTHRSARRPAGRDVRPRPVHSGHPWRRPRDLGRRRRSRPRRAAQPALGLWTSGAPSTGSRRRAWSSAVRSRSSRPRPQSSSDQLATTRAARRGRSHRRRLASPGPDAGPSRGPDRPRGRRHLHDRRDPRWPDRQSGGQGRRPGGFRSGRGADPGARALGAEPVRRPPSAPGCRSLTSAARMDPEDVRRIAHDPEDLGFLQSLDLRSWIVATMSARGRSLGTLTLITAGRSGATAPMTWLRPGPRDPHRPRPRQRRAVLGPRERRAAPRCRDVDARRSGVVHDATASSYTLNDLAARWLSFPGPEEALETTKADLLRRVRSLVRGWRAPGRGLIATASGSPICRGREWFGSTQPAASANAG